MAITLFASSSTTLTLDTPVDVDVNEVGVFEMEGDLSNLAAGDRLVLRIFQMTLTSGTRRQVLHHEWSGAQPSHDLTFRTLPISNNLTDSGALRFELEQTDGTGRSVPYKVLKHA